MRTWAEPDGREIFPYRFQAGDRVGTILLGTASLALARAELRAQYGDRLRWVEPVTKPACPLEAPTMRSGEIHDRATHARLPGTRGSR